MSGTLGTCNGERPAVSIIIPCYNLGRYLEEAVASALAQTFQDFEIIIVNDGSTDEFTHTLLAGFVRPRTTVLQTENRGLPAARNFAIKHARGRYICALDADDRLHPRFLEKTIPVLDANPSLAFASTWLETFGTENWIWRQDRCDLGKLLSECVVLTAAPVRREAVDAVGGYDERFSEGDEDWDFWISIVEKGYRGTIVPEVLFYYRRRFGSMSTVCTKGSVRTRLWTTLLEKHKESYRRYASEVLLLKERECGRILRENWLAERAIERVLKPRIAERRAELHRLQAELERVAESEISVAAAPEADVLESERVRELDQALACARAEVVALRASLSWKLSAPLRWGFDVWLAARLRLRGPDANAAAPPRRAR